MSACLWTLLLVLIGLANHHKCSGESSISTDTVESINNAVEVALDGDASDKNIPFTTTPSATLKQASNASSRHAALECGIWLAPSAIEGAGLGMYAGKDFKEGELLQDVGDLCIPIVDINQHNMGEEFEFLWDEYTWNAASLGADGEGFHEVNGASPGFGSAANSFLPVVNVDELTPRRDYVGLHRSRDPGAGAFSPYYDRGSAAERDIKAGEEFYVHYGENWFHGRAFLGPIPLTHDLDKATVLFKAFQSAKKRLAASVPESVFDELWDTFVRNSAYKNESRVLGGFHHDDKEEMKLLEEIQSVKELRIREATRTQEWLRQYGTCGDHIRGGVSTLDQAGHGAFASRHLPAGTIVAQLPLIHITNRTRLNMYHFSKHDKEKPSRAAGERNPQLLLNYCYGHGESTLLLCPYGPMVNYINHNQTLANVRLSWADPARGNFMPHLLDGSLQELEKDATAKLAFELVATRTIEEGEEIFLDYGDDWEKAWQQHVDSWYAVDGAEDYRSVEELNVALREQQIKLATEFDLVKDPSREFRAPHVDLTCNNYFSDDLWRPEFEKGNLDEGLKKYEDSAEFLYCYILRVTTSPTTGEPLFTVEARNDDDTQSYIWEDCPQVMFQFLEKPYTSDIFLENAFRHDIRIPNEMFPLAWRNLSPNEERGQREKDS